MFESGSKTFTIAALGVGVGLLVATIYQMRQFAVLEEEHLELSESFAELNENFESLQRSLSDLNASIESLSAITYEPSGCATNFPVGLYQLTTSTRYSTVQEADYDIYHVTTDLAGWQVNAGFRVNSFLIPTDFYFDYDGDGIIDTALAARLVREIPMAGISLADRLISNTPVHQALYDVFSCEWRNAEYTSVQDVNDGVSDASIQLWRLVEDHSAELIKWIQEEDSSAVDHDP